LVDELWLFHTRLRSDGEHDGGNLVDRRDVENEFLVRGQLTLAFKSKKNDWRSCGEAFVPAREGIILSRLDDARPHNAADHVGLGGN
jgi:hypothetical protein